MNKFLLVATLGPAFHLASAVASAAQLNDRPRPPQAGEKAIVVLPTALQRDRYRGRTWKMGEGRRLRLGIMSGRGALSDLLPLGAQTPGRALGGVEFDQKTEWGFANIKLGTIRQTNTLLGKPSDLSPLMRATRTTFSSLSLGYGLTPSTSLVGMASFGRTSGIQSAALHSALKPGVAAAFSVGLSTRKLFGKHDSAGLALIAPTRGAGITAVDGTLGAPRGVSLGAQYGIDF